MRPSALGLNFTTGLPAANILNLLEFSTMLNLNNREWNTLPTRLIYNDAVSDWSSAVLVAISVERYD